MANHVSRDFVKRYIDQMFGDPEERDPDVEEFHKEFQEFMRTDPRGRAWIARMEALLTETEARPEQD